jgi:hypothetical protein
MMGYAKRILSPIWTKPNRHYAKDISFVPLIDGVYCDMSFKRGENVRYGIAWVKNNKIQARHTFCSVINLGTDLSEVVAIKIAKELYPSERVFTDSRSAAAMCDVRWVDRCFNHVAHTTANADVKPIELNEEEIKNLLGDLYP